MAEDPVQAAVAAQSQRLEGRQQDAAEAFMEGVRWETGAGGERDPVKARAQYEKAIALGQHHTAEAHLGRLHLYGYGGLARSVAEAKALFEASAAGDDPLGVACVGMLYLTGRGGVDRDEAKAAQHFQASGHPEAQARLAGMLQKGRGGLARDEAKALRLLRASAGAGWALGQARLSQAHNLGALGLVRDEAEGTRLAKLSAAQGHPEGLVQLARATEFGKGGLDVDKKRAADLYQASAATGNSRGLDMLGEILLTGRCGIAADEAEGERLLNLASAQGNAGSMCGLARHYRKQGDGGKDAEALKLLESSAALGYGAAEADLGVAAMLGQLGLPKSDDAAAKHFLVAALECGDSTGMRCLADFLVEGRGGVETDKVEALRLYRCVAAKGGSSYNQEAADALVAEDPSLEATFQQRAESRALVALVKLVKRAAEGDAAAVAKVYTMLEIAEGGEGHGFLASSKPNAEVLAALEQRAAEAGAAPPARPAFDAAVARRVLAEVCARPRRRFGLAQRVALLERAIGGDAGAAGAFEAKYGNMTDKERAAWLKDDRKELAKLSKASGPAVKKGGGCVML